jgi:DNA-directed RNA polymerase subunit L
MEKFTKLKATIVELNKCKDDYSNSSIKIKLENITFHYANMLRRILKTYVPTYAFSAENITIKKNSSIINNDQIRERFSNLPIMYVKNEEETVKKFLQLYDGEKIEDEFLTMYISYKNKSGKMEAVTTDTSTVKFYYQGKEIKSPYPKPLLLVKLHNGEEFECTCKAVLGLNLEEKFESPAIYEPVAACAYEQVEENLFILGYESKQQMSEKEAMRRALSCLIMRLEYLDNLVSEKVSEDSLKEGILLLPNEDMTLGGILGYILQVHPEMEFAGDYQPIISSRNMQIRYKCKENIKEIFSECVQVLIKSVNSLAKQLELDIISL